jgi:lipocalin-like protein
MSNSDRPSMISARPDRPVLGAQETEETPKKSWHPRNPGCAVTVPRLRFRSAMKMLGWCRDFIAASSQIAGVVIATPAGSWSLQLQWGLSIRALFVAVVLIGLCGPIFAGEEEIYGTWKCVSEQIKFLDTGETIDLATSGYIMYGRDGRMMGLLVRGVRPKPDSLATMTDQQRADLFKSMISSAGTYTFDGSVMEHHIDTSWNNIWTGTTIARDVRKDGDKLVYTTKPAPYSANGSRMVTDTVIWEKVK